MNDSQEDQLSMQRTCLEVRNTYSAEIAALADVDADFDALQAEVDATNTQALGQKEQTTGVTTDKHDQEVHIIQTALVLSGAGMAFARTTNNNALFNDLQISKT